MRQIGDGLRLGVRGRVVVAVMLVLGLALLVANIVLRLVLVSALDVRVEQELRQEAAELERLAVGVDPLTGEPFGLAADRVLDVFFSVNVPGERESYLGLVDGEVAVATPGEPQARLDPAVLRRWSQAGQVLRERVQVDGARREVLVVPLLGEAGSPPAAQFVTIYAYAEERSEIEDALSLAAAVSGLSFLLGAVLAVAAARRALRPLAAVTRAVRHAGQDTMSLAPPLAVPPGRDEVAVLAEAFNEMLRRLEEVFATQREFLADVGHELRTPLTIVRGHLEVMGEDPKEMVETRRLVLDELDRMARLVSDVTLLARSVRPDFLRVGPVPLGSLVDDVLANARVLAPRRWVYDGADDAVLQADGQRLAQAALQLVDNAVRQTGPADVIGVGARVDDGTVRLWVRDSGPGVAAADRDRVFARSVRGARATQDDGSGLGLAIVAAIAGAHGGRVELDLPSPGDGARFTLVLPLVRGGAGRDEGPPHGPPDDGERRRRPGRRDDRANGYGLSEQDQGDNG